MEKWRIREWKEQMVQVGWYFTPQWIKNKILERRETKRAKRELEIFHNNKISEQDVRDALDKLDIHGDVMLHSSLVEIGNIQGRHKPFVNYLQEKVLDKGHTLIAIAIPIKGSTSDYLQSISQFDEEAPIAMGAISTYYAKQDGACRSLNPTHSVVAYGPLAEEYTAEHHIDKTAFTEKSPYYKFLEQNGSVLMIGAGIKHLTIMHIVEDMMGDLYPCRVYERKPHAVDIYKGGECVHKGQYFAHSPWMSSLRSDSYMIDCIKALPTTKIVNLGAAEISYINARDAVICELEELRKGNSIYGYRRINKECRERIDYWINKIMNMKN